MGKRHRKRAVGKPCAYCAEPMTGATHKDNGATLEHIRPHALCSPFTAIGGTPRPWDRAMACRRCNGDKGDAFLGEWLVRLRIGGDPRAPIVRAFIDQWLLEHAAECDREASHGNPSRSLERLEACTQPGFV